MIADSPRPDPTVDGHEDFPRGLPPNYTRLAPFASWLTSGGGVLMYHKLGPRPPGVRLKGLYVSSTLFERQLAELRAAAFRSASLDTWNPTPAPAAREMLLTFDDGFENVLRFGLEPLRRHGFQAIQFLLPNLLGKTNEWETRDGEAPQRLMDVSQVREWLAAGHDIGAHTCTHPWLTRIPLAQAREEIRASKARLEDQFGRPIRHFCYPYGDWNPPIRDAVVDAGFQTACTTVPGRNRPDGDPFRLRRLTARYASRNWKSLWQALRALLGR